MAKANGSLSYDNLAINVLMRRAAIQGAKEERRAAGVKVSLVHCAELHRLAKEYLSANEAQLIAQARQKWRAMNEPRTGNGVVSPAPVRSKARA
jgi:hypothetical protein